MFKALRGGTFAFAAGPELRPCFEDEGHGPRLRVVAEAVERLLENGKGLPDPPVFAHGSAQPEERLAHPGAPGGVFPRDVGPQVRLQQVRPLQRTVDLGRLEGGVVKEARILRRNLAEGRRRFRQLSQPHERVAPQGLRRRRAVVPGKVRQEHGRLPQRRLIVAPRVVEVGDAVNRLRLLRPPGGVGAHRCQLDQAALVVPLEEAGQPVPQPAT